MESNTIRCSHVVDDSAASATGTRNFFTLTEALIALILLALTAAALISLLVFHTRLSNHLDRQRVASQLATSRMEQLNRMPFDEMTLAAEDNVPVTADGIPNEDGPFYRTSSFATDANGNVIITVAITSGGDSLRPEATFQLVTLRANK